MAKIGESARVQFDVMADPKPLVSEPRRRGRPNKTSVEASLDIRKAALKAFAHRGFHGTSIAEIARMAGVAKPLVHYHFASKDALWEAAVGGAVADLLAKVGQFQEALNTSASTQDLLRAVSRQLVVFASSHPELVRIVVDETGKGESRADWLRNNLLMPGYATGKLLLQGLARSAENGTPAVEHLVPLILGVMNFPFLDARAIHDAYGVDVFGKDYLERHSEILFQVLRSLL